MDTGYFPHHSGSGIQSMDGCAVDQMVYGTEVMPDTSDISCFQHYDEQIGAISPELTFMPQSLDTTMVRSLLVPSLCRLNLAVVATRLYPGGGSRTRIGGFNLDRILSWSQRSRERYLFLLFGQSALLRTFTNN